MAKITFPEVGYTPKNLQNIRHYYKLTQQQVADIVGVTNWRQVAKWEADVTLPSHSDMPHKKWLILLSYLSIRLPLG